MISFFTTLKPLRGLAAVQEVNALRSWRAAVPDCEIIVFDALDGGEALLKEVGANHQLDIRRNEFGTPLISAMFAEAQRIARHDVLCYINGDILIEPDFAEAIARISHWRTFCAVGRRWDIDLDRTLDFNKPDWQAELRRIRAEQGVQHDALAHDYFAFRRGAVTGLPEFAVGRPTWDNFLIRHLSALKVPIVDLSEATRPLHQNHDYGHIAKRRGTAWEGPEADRNRRLAAETFGYFNPRYYSIDNAAWEMRNRSVFPVLAPKRLSWRLKARLLPDTLRDRISNYLYSLRFLSKNLHKLARFLDLYSAALPYALLPRRPKSVAVIRVDNIGDYLLWLDGARAIRKRYPSGEYRVTLLASSKWSELADASGLFDEVVAVDRSRFFAEPSVRRAVCRDVARQRFEVVVNPTYSRDTWADDFLVRAASAKTAIGHVGNLDNQPSAFVKRLTDSWYTTLSNDADGPAHETEKNAAFARQFDPDTQVRTPELPPSSIQKPAWLPVGPYFVLFGGAQRDIRRWPAERFADIARRLHARTGWTGVICGLASDATIAQQIKQLAPSVPLLDSCGKTDIRTFAGVVAGASLVVTNDTSTAHLAATLGRPAVVVLGGGHFGRFLPYLQTGAGRDVRAVNTPMPCYGCGWHCIYEIGASDPAPCITGVSADDVWREIESLVEGGVEHASASRRASS